MLPDSDFWLLFRIDQPNFFALLVIVREELLVNEEMAVLSAGQAIRPECRLSLALYALAGAFYLDCMLAFDVGRSTVFANFHEVCAQPCEGKEE